MDNINMNIGLNTMINNLSAKIIQDISDSQLPVGIVYLTIKNIFYDVQKVYEETLKSEMEQAKKNDSIEEENKEE